MYQRFVLLLVLGLSLVGETIVQAEDLQNLVFTLTPTESVSNVLDLDGSLDWWGGTSYALTQQSLATGTVTVNLLGVSFSGGVGAVQYVQFVGTPTTPGTVGFADATLTVNSPPDPWGSGDPNTYDQISGTVCGAQAIIYSNPLAVTGGSFSLAGIGEELNVGTATGTYVFDVPGLIGGPETDEAGSMDFSVDPQSAIVNGNTGIVSIVQNGSDYYATLDLSMNSDQKIVGSMGLWAHISGDVHAVYGSAPVSTPEPGTLVMLLTLATSLAVYGWKRRG